MSSRLWSATLLAAALIASPAVGQSGASSAQTRSVPRDRAPTSQNETALVRGRIVAADTRLGLRRASVRLASVNGSLQRVVLSGVDGEFEFTGLPSGRYSFVASKAGYVALRPGASRTN